MLSTNYRLSLACRIRTGLQGLVAIYCRRTFGSSLTVFQTPGPQQPIFFAVDTHIFDDCNKSPMVFLGFTDPRTENLQQVTAKNTGRGDGSMDFDRCRKILTAARRDWSRYSSLACVDIMSAYNFLKTGAVEEGNRKGGGRTCLSSVLLPRDY